MYTHTHARAQRTCAHARSARAHTHTKYIIIYDIKKYYKSITK